MDTNWQKLTPAEKFEARVRDWQYPAGVPFASAAIKQAFEDRVQLFKDVIQLKVPQRVPVAPNVGFYPFAYAGVTTQEALYDYDKLGYALKKYHADFLPDTLSISPIYGAGKVFELLDYKLYRWPGHGVGPQSPYQCVEGEYMRADEYDDFIRDPSAYFMRAYLPRVFGALGGWPLLPPLTDILELPFLGGFVVPLGLPPVQETFQKLIQAGQAALEWIQACTAIDAASVTNLGLTALMGGFTKAPFDTLGDTLRGTRAIMLDMFRQPGKLLAALERLVPIAIEMGVRSSTANHHPVVFIPLHKGADGFMSDADFKKFYWPSLKAVILGLVAEGAVPYLFAEGGYNQRLDVVADPDIPAGSTIWIFDQSDMREVHRRFKGWACFGGNVPLSLLKAGTPAQVSDYVKRLIDDVGPDGGFILSSGAVVDDAEPENLHAMIETGKTHGVYRPVPEAAF